jgi:hypothetical protein
MTAEDLAEYIQTLCETSMDALDQILHEMLVRVYVTREAQNS